MNYIGIDISKKTLDVAIMVAPNKFKHYQFSNEMKGYKALLTWVSDQVQDMSLYCLEATGIYGFGVAEFLYEQSQKVCMVNPVKTNAFAKLEMTRTKTDQVDASLIARFAKYLDDSKTLEKQLWQPKSQNFEQLQIWVTRLEQLSIMINIEKNHKEGFRDAGVKKSIQKIIDQLEKQVEAIKAEINRIVSQDPLISRQVELLKSIPAVADKTAWCILAYLGDIELFDNSKQVASYAGLNPKIEQSGSSLNRSSLSKKGHKRLRKALYMPAITAIRHNPVIRALAERLLEKGKPKMKAVGAAMRKLLVLAYGVLKSGKAFDPNYKGA